MSLILGLDLETTGLDSRIDSVTEIGAVLYDTDTNTPLKILSEIISINTAIPDRITTLTGITDAIITKYGRPIPEVINKLNEMSKEAEFLVIHNASFDVSFLSEIDKALPVDCLNLKILDTMKDLPLDSIIHPSVKLPFLCATHGFLNPFSHRAIFDVLSMLKVLSNYDVKEVYARSISKDVEIISLAPFAQKDEVKGQGFRWTPDRKLWIKTVKECDFKQEEHLYEFGTSITVLE